MKNLLKDRKTLYLVLGLVMVSVFTLTVVYAALSVTLNITGTADISAASWDVHLDNVKVKSGSVSGNAPTITGGTTATFSTTLTTPGDFYEFTVDVVNSGSIDAMIDGVSKTPTLTTTQAKYFNYIVEYENGETITTKQLVAKDSFVRLKVRVEFRKDITASDLPTTSETLNLAFTVIYVQSDGSGSSVKDNGAEIKLVSANGSLDTIGTVVTIGEQQFYTIGTEGDNVKLLSMYNLHVGNSVDEEYHVTPLENPTGMQSAKGYIYSNLTFPFIGTTAFSKSSSAYEGSIVEGYVNNYKIEIEKLGVEVIEARLITKDELTFICSSSCNNSPYPFINSTSYWIMPVYSGDSINNYAMTNKGNDVNLYNKFTDFHAGVRPVIVISKNYF